MGNAVYPFSGLQVGRETSAGTEHAALCKFVGDGFLKEMENKHFSEYPRGIRGPRGGAGTVVTRWCEAEIESELNACEILYPLITGIKGNITPVPGATSDADAISWTFAFNPTALPTIDSLTGEFFHSDGSSNLVVVQALYMMTSGYSINWSAEDVAKLKWKLFGQANIVGATPTAAMVPMTNRDVSMMVGPSSGVYLDDDWASLGDTLLSGIVRDATLDVDTGVKPDWTLSSRSRRDWGAPRYGKFGAKFNVTVELNSSSKDEYASFRAGDLRFGRVISTGPVVGASAIPYTVQHDFCCRFTEAPTFQENDEYTLMQLSLEVCNDEADSGNTFEAVVITDIDALAAI